MANDDNGVVWMYDPSFALAVLASVLYGVVFLCIFYLTVIKYRAWYFTCVVIGAASEVAGYALRCYSIKQPTLVVRMPPLPLSLFRAAAPSQLMTHHQGPFAASLSLVVLAPVLVAAGNYLLIGRLIQAVLSRQHTGHRVLGLHGRLLTRVFVACDVLCTLVQCSGSGIASSSQWQGANADLGVKVLIGGLALQAAAFAVFMGVFGRFHYVAVRKGLVAADAPAGWERVVVAVWVSSVLILVRLLFFFFLGGRVC